MECVSPRCSARRRALSNKELHKVEELAKRLAEEAGELERQYMKGALL
jgi:hypothetical protein